MQMKITASQLSNLLEEIKTLMELNGENPFKSRAFGNAADKIRELGDSEDWETRTRTGKLTELPGIGKGIAEVITDFVQNGQSKVQAELERALPEGLLELSRVPGLGPKKARSVIETLGIKTLGELEYACAENRLATMKGFGEKSQAKILEGVRFLRAGEGLQPLPVAEADGLLLETALKKLAGSKKRVELAGALRMRREVIDSIDFVIEKGAVEAADWKSKLDELSSQRQTQVPVRLHEVAAKNFESEWLKQSSSPEHWTELGATTGASEQAIYESAGYAWVPAESREWASDLALFKKSKPIELVQTSDIHGAFHFHTVASDGALTLEEVIQEAISRNWKFIGVSDHSQSAFYAQGLKSDALKKQRDELEKLRKKYPQIRIFWGIESDILGDGGLDYDESTLGDFDFVIASIHSRFQMDREAMTERLIRAVENPATTMLGHLTGRILLGRKGYDIDFDRVFEACAKHGVSIELNSHPSRLDVDWRHGEKLRKLGIPISLNPDAHERDGFNDIRYGVDMARKACLPKSQIINSWNVEEIEKWLKK